MPLRKGGQTDTLVNPIFSVYRLSHGRVITMDTKNNVFTPAPSLKFNAGV